MPLHFPRNIVGPFVRPSLMRKSNVDCIFHRCAIFSLQPQNDLVQRRNRITNGGDGFGRNYHTPQSTFRKGSGHFDRLNRSYAADDVSHLQGKAAAAAAANTNDSHRQAERKNGRRSTTQSTNKRVVGEAEYIRQRLQQDKFRDSLDSYANDLHMSRAFQFKRQKAIAEAEGVDAAIRDALVPNEHSFERRLEQMPLDPKILEEIHRDAHGKRFDRPLTNGLHFEKWISRDPQNLSVQTASTKAKEAFAFGGSMELIASASSPQQFPVSSTSEVAFVGATNSGRSALLNALSNTFLCEVGDLPGTTRTANFYSLSGKVNLVDLPGYGYYNPVETTRTDAEGAVRVLDTYLELASMENRVRNVRRVYVCVSARQPLHEADYNMFERLQRNGNYFSVILTKTDLVPITRLARMVEYFRQQLGAYDCCKQLMLVSSMRLCGVQRIQTEIANFSISHHKSQHTVDTDFSDLV